MQPERLREVLRDRADEARVQRIWNGVEARRRSRALERRWPWLALAIVPLLAWLALRAPSPPAPEAPVAAGPLRLHDEAPFPARVEEDVQLADGSRIALRAGARLELLENDGATFGLALRRGRARFAVRPGGPRAWRVEADGVAVHVVGTVFEVARDEGAVEVSVSRGAVLVRGPRVPDGVQRLEAGQRLRVAPEEPPPAPSARTPAGPPASAEAPPPERPRWREAARERRFEEAWEALGDAGHAREVRRVRGADGLLELADVARFSGHAADAVAPLQRLLAEHPDDPRAALAAYTLARIELGRGRASEAARALETGEELGLPAALAEPAAALRVRALGEAGRTDEARAAAEAFLARWPASPRRDSVARWGGP